jgi:hypothetical protein
LLSNHLDFGRCLSPSALGELITSFSLCLGLNHRPGDRTAASTVNISLGTSALLVCVMVTCCSGPHLCLEWLCQHGTRGIQLPCVGSSELWGAAVTCFVSQGEPRLDGTHWWEGNPQGRFCRPGLAHGPCSCSVHVAVAWMDALGANGGRSCRSVQDTSSFC